jgi:hypothetical protein
MKKGFHMRVVLAVIGTIHADTEALAYEVVGIRGTPIFNTPV